MTPLIAPEALIIGTRLEGSPGIEASCKRGVYGWVFISKWNHMLRVDLA